MKRNGILAAFIALCLILCTACSSTPPNHGTTGGNPVGTPYKRFEEECDNYPGVDLVVVDGTVTSTSAEILLINETGFGMSCYGDNYIRVQKEVDGAWYDLSAYNIPVNSGGPWMFDADVEYRETVKWEPFYGTLSPGHYRIVKSCSVRTESDRVLLLLTAEFNLE